MSADLAKGSILRVSGESGMSPAGVEWLVMVYDWDRVRAQGGPGGGRGYMTGKEKHTEPCSVWVNCICCDIMLQRELDSSRREA